MLRRSFNCPLHCNFMQALTIEDSQLTFGGLVASAPVGTTGLTQRCDLVGKFKTSMKRFVQEVEIGNAKCS
ncbi:hypothetical protein CEXT_577361 [Caerostris extrusa]|uniref:Uncharacterized protein n=1 Tax=Caerostris extrusa TaxID=172846 RepID=A0AAV4RJE3_CAEEX|nr:hypothetical protein CEXT_577361 [Caerostris extrusa]